MAAYRFNRVPTSESRREMHIAAHAKISWIDDLVCARVYIGKPYPSILYVAILLFSIALAWMPAL